METGKELGEVDAVESGMNDKEKTMDKRVIQAEQIENNFTYHPPQDDQPLRHKNIRAAAKEFALLIVAETPASREQSLALTNLEQAVFWANAAIARHG